MTRLDEAACLLESNWDDHPDYPTEDWTDEVINGYTRQGYRDWVFSKIEQEEGTWNSYGTVRT